MPSALIAIWPSTSGPAKSSGGPPGGRPEDPTYSNPVVTVIGGQRLIIAGNADGYMYAIKARTGEKVWGFQPANAG